ncbi:MAG: tungstate ABC transporter ATP-binding protein WtpC [Actinomycetota bacterium]|nr:tungstate ABC transporter ATP-binding protein WtpC [Actinomycetota bacterium]
MIHIEDVYKDLGEFALKGVTLDVEDGDYLIILGPTGAGKTILLETVAGIYNPDRGKVYLNGEDVTDIPPRKRNIGMVYQDYMLFPHLTVESNIRFGLKARKDKKEQAREKSREMAEMLGIDHLLHRYPGTLSGGEQQRVAIARALIVKPDVLLLDEPLSALDAETRARLREELQRIHDMTRTIMIHVTHSFDEAFLLGNRMAIMNKGKIVQVGETGEVFRRPNSKFVADFVGTTNIYQGESRIVNGVSRISMNQVDILSSQAISGPVYTTLRPESILVSLHPLESSARNLMEGNIERIMDEGSIIKIEVNVGVPLISAITRRSYDDMELCIGKKVYLTFKATDVHVFSI